MALATAVLQLAVMFLVPPIAWVVLTRRLGVSWRMVGLGCLTWLTAMPFIIGVPMAATAVFGPQPLVWPVALSLTAGIVEETSRFLYYRRSAALRDRGNWRGALVAGAAHGGVESIVLGLQTAAGVVAFFFMRDWLPAEMQAIQPEPAYFLIGAGSRLLIMIGHVGFTFLVWRAVSRAGEGWLYPLAIVLHIAIDLIAFAQPIVLPGADWMGFVAVIALAAGSLWLIRQSRSQHQGIAMAV
ncbi:MAG TPA: YhfC family glutamic-type intramembrane protease [Anaerolineales bacterium]|nr:YhfC family glutamic-type intramembrane protease [Anaerolineales bacterium]